MEALSRMSCRYYRDFPRDGIRNGAAAALAMTASAGGGVTITTTVLLTPEEIDTAANAGLEYRPPGFS